MGHLPDIETVTHVLLAIVALLVPLCFAYVVVRRLGKRSAPRGSTSADRRCDRCSPAADKPTLHG
jgi:hypothetical protein